MIRVEWVKSALDRHEAWALNIALEFTTKHSQSYLNDIQNSISNIAAHPLIGTPYPTISRPNLRRLVTGGRYNVFYDLDSEQEPTKATIVSVVRGAV